MVPRSSNSQSLGPCRLRGQPLDGNFSAGDLWMLLADVPNEVRPLREPVEAILANIRLLLFGTTARCATVDCMKRDTDKKRSQIQE